MYFAYFFFYHDVQKCKNCIPKCTCEYISEIERDNAWEFKRLSLGNMSTKLDH